MNLREIQERLSQFGFHTGGVDGNMRPSTVEAVRRFQRAYCGPKGWLVVDGDPGPLTQEAMAFLPRLSTHFIVSELWCKHCKQVGVVRELLSAVELLRDKVAKPVFLASAYRCPTHNSAVGGAPYSVHKLGAAVDINLFQSSITVAQARSIGRFSGIGTRGQGRLASHLDVRHLMGANNKTPAATPQNPMVWPYD